MEGSGVLTWTAPSTRSQCSWTSRRTAVAIHPAVAIDQGSRLLTALPLPQEEQHLGAFPRFELHFRLQGGTRIQAGSDLSRKLRATLQRRGVVEARVAAQELEAIAGPGGLAAAQVGERDPVRELPVPGVSREHGSGRGVDVGDHERRGARAPDTQHPLRIGRHRKPPFAAGPILQSEARDLDRVTQRYELQEIQCDAVGCVLESTVPLTVPDDIGPGFFADGETGRPPDQTAVLIAHIERLARSVADGIVRPGRELVLPAVLGPGIARARLGDLETEPRVGHHVDPGSRGPLPLAQNRDVFSAVRCESSQAVEELEIQCGGGNGLGRLARRAEPRRDRPRPRPLQPHHLLGQRTPARQDHHSRRRAQEDPIPRGQEVGPEHEYASMFPMLLVADRGLACSHHGFEGLLEILRVGGALRIEDHQIGGNPLQVPVLVRPHELPDDVPLLVPLDAHQSDRKIAGDAVGPEPGRAIAVPGQYLRRRAQRGIGVQQTIGQALEEMRLVLGDPEVVQLNLGLCPGQRALSLERCRLAVLLRNLESLFPGRRHERGEHEIDRPSSGNRHAVPEAHDGIQNRSRRVRKGPPVNHGERRPNPAAPAQEACAVALVLQLADRLPLDRGQMGEPDLGLDCRTRAPCGQQGPELGNELRLHEQVRKRGVGLVRAPAEPARPRHRT